MGTSLPLASSGARILQKPGTLNVAQLKGHGSAFTKRPDRLHSRPFPGSTCPRASAESQGSEEDEDSAVLDEQRRMLSRMASSSSMSGQELKDLVMAKWNRYYDVRLQKRGQRIYLHVMWKHLGQKSFRMTEEEYDQQLEAIAEYLTIWGAAETVRSGIQAAKYAPGFTTGGAARAYSIPLNVDLSQTGRGSEWN